MNLDTARKIQPTRYPNIYCSQCGRSFGPGNFGYSHCSDHAVITLKELNFEPIKRALDPGICRFAEQLVIGSGNGPQNNDAAFADWRDAQAQDLAEQIQQVYDDWLMVD